VDECLGHRNLVGVGHSLVAHSLHLAAGDSELASQHCSQVARTDFVQADQMRFVAVVLDPGKELLAVADWVPLDSS